MTTFHRAMSALRANISSSEVRHSRQRILECRPPKTLPARALWSPPKPQLNAHAPWFFPTLLCSPPPTSGSPEMSGPEKKLEGTQETPRAEDAAGKQAAEVDPALDHFQAKRARFERGSSLAATTPRSEPPSVTPVSTPEDGLEEKPATGLFHGDPRAGPGDRTSKGPVLAAVDAGRTERCSEAPPEPPVCLGPPGPKSSLWGSSPVAWAHACLEDFEVLDVHAALLGLWECPAEPADWFGLSLAEAEGVRARYSSSPAALRVLKARWQAKDRMMRSRISADYPHWLHRCALDFKDQGNALFKKKNFLAALERYEMAVAACPDDLLFSNNLAAALIELGRYDECFSMCQQLLDRRHLIEHAAPDGATDEKVARTLGRMASCLEQQQKYDEALALRRQAAATHDSPQTQAAIANCERLMGHAG